MVKRDIFERTKVKQKSRKMKSINVRQKLSVAALVAVMAFGLVISPLVTADRFDNQISQLQAENEHSHDEVNALEIYARDIQDAINKLQARINQLQANIQVNKRKSDDLKRQIIEAEAELEKQKSILGQNIRAMYLEGDISTLEMLATSKNLSEFVDKEQYRNSVKDKIKAQLDKVNALRLTLKTQRQKVEELIREDEKMRNEISKQKAEQDRLFAMNQAQQAEFNRKIAANNKKIEELRNAQAALARKLAAGKFVSLGPIRQGEVIGVVGNTGFSTGAHLHLEARNSGGSLVNPNNYLGSGWIRPVSGGYISQGYGVYNPWYLSGYHPGIDYAGVTGNPVYAVADGDIISRGCSQDSPFFGGTPAYGYAVVIRHHNGVFSIYGHMSPPASGYGHCNYSYGF